MAVQVYSGATAISDLSKTEVGKHNVSEIYPKKADFEIEEADTDCTKRFIKLKVCKEIIFTKRICFVDGDVVVSGNSAFWRKIFNH